MRIVALICLLICFAGPAISDTTVIVNGKTIIVPGSSVSIINNQVIVDGIAVAGEALKGSGNILSERRALKDFSVVRLNIPAAVTLRHGETPGCLVRADDNILPIISTTTLDGILNVDAERNFASTHFIEIAITTPVIQRVELNASGQARLHDVEAGSLALLIRGSGSIGATGKVEGLAVSVDGSGNINASALSADDVDVTINGSGNATVQANERLNATINGSGSILFLGDPPALTTSVRGSGSIRHR